MRPQRFGDRNETSEKIELVLRLLSGVALGELARETSRPKKQLAAWRHRFLEGGEAALEGSREQPELEALRGEHEKLRERAEALAFENRMLARRVAILSGPSGSTAPHPYCSEAYARASEEPGVEPLHVPAWDTFVLVREGRAGVRQATGLRPFGSLDPRCDLRAGLDQLHEAGVASFSAITDPMWCPEAPALRAAFDLCRPFTEYHLVDREAEVHIRKRHRNRINQALRAGEVRDVALGDHLDRWFELYQGNVDERQIAQPFTRAYFERMATFGALRTVAVVADGEIATMSMWLPHHDTMYFHDGASSAVGKAISAAHAAFAHIIETAGDCRYVLLGGAADFRDKRSDGLAEFKRGFANVSLPSYLCTSSPGHARWRDRESS